VFIGVHLWFQILLLAFATVPAAAHLNALSGHLIDIVAQSDVAIVGVVTKPASLSPGGKELTIDVGSVLLGELTEKTLKAQTSVRLAMGERQVIFLKREPFGYRCVQPSGTRFQAAPEDDADYRRVVNAIHIALQLPPDQQIQPLRAALIPALRSASMSLRYHAALDLGSLTHSGHELTAEERTQIEAIRSAAGVDPALRPILDALLSPGGP